MLRGVTISGIFLTASQLGVPQVPEGVTQKVESEHHHENSQTGEDGDPRRRRAVLFSIPPQLGTSGGMPTPRKLKEASMVIASPT